MLIFSLIFYAWGGPKYLLLLLSEVLISWYFGIQINNSYKIPGSRGKRKAKLYLIGDLILMLGLLVIFKYLGFFTSITSSLLSLPKNPIVFALPIGISFYTFQLISYDVDVYRREVNAQQSYFKLLLYASLFHQCIAGPIVRYQTVQNEIDNRLVSSKDLLYGIRRFALGLAKKAILANGCAVVADQLLPTSTKLLNTIPSFGLFIGIVFYSLQIYLDFSAYSDMAIGMGRMIGFHYLENFNYPYIAKSIKDFWSRWHISLSTFFRDYVYIPLGGSRCSKNRNIINLLIVWGLTGFWHGASWNFIFWGLWFFIFLILERNFLSEKLFQLPKFVSHIYTLIVVFNGWILFRCTNLSQIGTIIKGLITGNSNGFINSSTWIILKNNIFLLIFCILASTPIFKNIRQLIVIKGYGKLTRMYDILVPSLLIILSFIALIGDSYNPFLYFRF